MAGTCNYKHIVVVHGIGDQEPNETALGFMNEFIRALPLGGDRRLTVHNLIESVDRLVEAKPEKPQKFQPAYVVYSNGVSVNVIGFSEVYWQPITNGYIESNGNRLPVPVFTWAHSIATRLLGTDGGGSTYRLAGWRAAIDNLETMLKLLARLAGTFDRKEAFDAVTTRFLGDVQMYAESDDIRQKVNGKFFNVLSRVNRFAEETRNSIRGRRTDPLFAEFAGFNDFDAREIYVVAHSEGTVVAYNSLVQAQMINDGCGGYPDQEYVRAEKEHSERTANEDRAWLARVRGLVTLGSPLDKHYLIWRSRFRKHQLKRPPERKIPWLNFYDFNDPVAYSLRELRTPEPGAQATETDAVRMFDLEADGSDTGFKRYPIPGVAHMGYWKDRPILDQIVHLMGLSPVKPTFPGSIFWVRMIRLPAIWLLYPILRAGTFAAGLFFLNRLLHAGGYLRLGPLAALHDWLYDRPLGLDNPMNYVFWLVAPVLLMKLLVEAEQGLGFSRWWRWILSVTWLALAVVICLGLSTSPSDAGLLDLLGYVTGIFTCILVWKLHTAVHRGLIQLWHYTAVA